MLRFHLETHKLGQRELSLQNKGGIFIESLNNENTHYVCALLTLKGSKRKLMLSTLLSDVMIPLGDK